MATHTHVGGYRKYFGTRFADLSPATTTEDQIRDVYNDWANKYDEEVVVKALLVCHRPQAECLDAAIKQYLNKPKDEVKIIDCGAGTGLCGVELHKLGYTHLCALDISPEMLNEARKKNVYQKFICAPLNSDQNPEVITGEYDAMICIGTLAAAHVKPTALVEMIRMIKIDGLLSFNIRFGELELYQPMMEELEKEGKWVNVVKETIPHFQTDDMPQTSSFFVYKILKH